MMKNSLCIYAISNYGDLADGEVLWSAVPIINNRRDTRDIYVFSSQESLTDFILMFWLDPVIAFSWYEEEEEITALKEQIEYNNQTCERNSL